MKSFHFLIKISDNNWAINSDESISLRFQRILIQLSSVAFLYTSQRQSQSIYAAFWVNKFSSRINPASNTRLSELCKLTAICSKDLRVFSWPEHSRSNNKRRWNRRRDLLTRLWKKDRQSNCRRFKIWNNLKYKKSSIIFLWVKQGKWASWGWIDFGIWCFRRYTW